MREVCGADGGYAAAPCPAEQVCQGGACVARNCTPGAATCATATSRSVCNPDGLGATTTPCPSGQGCVGGACAALACAPGSAVCVTATSRMVCNADGQGFTTTACAAPAHANDPRCTGSGVCRFTCEAGYGDCNGAAADGCEATLDTIIWCGSCSTPCATRPNSNPACVAGACALACAPGFADCNRTYSDGCEVNTATSQTHCGACGVACGSGQVCRAGVCVAGCPGTGSLCGGVCRELTSDRANCGTCGTACPAGQGCSAGVCRVGPNDGDVRLNSGILEFYNAGEWRNVCDDSVMGVAEVACRQLGFRTGTAMQFQNCVSSGFWLDDVVCTGAEANLTACMHLPIGSHNCSNGECIRLTCTN